MPVVNIIKKQSTLEAIQYTEDNAEEVKIFIDVYGKYIDNEDSDPYFKIGGLGGATVANISDWIIAQPGDRFSVIQDKKFKSLFDIV